MRPMPVTALVLLIVLAGCTSHHAAAGGSVRASEGSGTDPVIEPSTAAAVRGAVEGLIAADNGGNPDLVVGFYADDAVLLPPQAAPIVGRDAIRSHYMSMFADHSLTLTARSEETLVSGDLAIDRGITLGSLSPKGGGQPSEVRDQYLMVLRRDASGRWKVLRVMWSPVEPTG